MSWDFELVAGPYNGAALGPVWDGEAMGFSHNPARRVLRFGPKTGGGHPYRARTHRTGWTTQP